MTNTRRVVQPERLRILREDAGYSIAGLARAMEVGAYTYLGRVERGVINPSPTYLKRIADTLGAKLRRPVDLDEFTARVPIEDAA
jgi:transcriptional regulator with XRE-family HTH domain